MSKKSQDPQDAVTLTDEQKELETLKKENEALKTKAAEDKNAIDVLSKKYSRLVNAIQAAEFNAESTLRTLRLV